VRPLKAETKQMAEQELRADEFLVDVGNIFFAGKNEDGLTQEGKRLHRRNQRCQKNRRKKKQEKVLQELAPIIAANGLTGTLMAVAARSYHDADAVLVRYGRPTPITRAVSSDLRRLALDIEIAVGSFKTQYGR
jgi:hypothetical protein